MKGFLTDTSLHAFALEPRIVFDADVAVTSSEVASASDESATTADTETTATTDEATSSSTSDVDNNAPEVTTDQDTITAQSTSSQSIYDYNIYDHVTSSIDDLIVSSDGNYAYAVSYSHSIVSVFAIADDGSLSLVQNLHNSDLSDVLTDGISGVSLVEFSSDQSQVTIYSETNQTLLTFSRDSETGELTYTSSTDLSDIIGTAALSDIQDNNGYLYATAGDSVYVLASSEDSSSLSLMDTETAGENDVEGISGNNTLTFSGDGSTLFVSSSTGDNQVVSIFAVNQDGSLTYSGAVTGSEKYYVNALVASDDGSVVYALQVGSDATEVITLSLNQETGDYEVVDTETVADDTSQLILSSDESTLFTFGTSVVSYAVESDGSLGTSTTMDSSAAKISSGVTTVAYAADSDEIITVTADAVSVYSYSTASVDYTEGNEAVAIVPSGVISDSELDALDDYNGATITINRDDTSDTSGDSYTFLEDNGLTLDNGQIYLDGNAVATWTASESGVSITFTAAVSQATAQSVLRQIGYQNTSDDPDAAGSSVTLDVTLDDGDGATSTLNVTLNLTDINDAPVLNGSGKTIDMVSGDDYVTLFSDASIDTVEAGQPIWKLSITVEGADSTDTLNVDGNIITLNTTSGAPQTVNGLYYQVMETDGVYTVVIFVSADASSTESLINNIQYRTTTEDRVGNVSFSLSVVEGDGTTSSSSIDSSVSLSASTNANETTDITVNNNNVTYTENSGETTILSGTTLSDTEMDARNGGEGNYSGAIITVTTDNSSTDGHLTIDSDTTYTYQEQQILKDGVVIATVESTDDGLTITFTEEYQTVPTTDDVNNILSLITYTNDSDALPDSSTVTLTVTDSFGHQSETHSVTINFTNENDVPEASLGELYATGVLSAITSSSDLDQLTDLTDSVISEDGKRLYIADSSGNVAIYSVDIETGALTYLSYTATSTDTAVDSVLTNDDGSDIYVIKSEADSDGFTYSEITVYSVSEDGTFTEVQVVSLTQSTYAVYQAMANFTLSDDGSYLFFTSSYSLYAYQIDSASGELTSVSNYSSAWSEPYIYGPTAITTSGDYLFVTTNYYSSSTLIAYKITTDGLEWVSYIRDGNTDSNGNSISINSSIIDLESSADGSTIYASTSSGITIYSFDTESESFSASSSLELSDIVDTALSADGKILYVSTSDSQLIRFSIDGDGSLTVIDSTAINANDATLKVTDNGDLLVGDAEFTYYQVADYTLDVEVGGSTTLMPIISVSDADEALTDSYQNFVFSVTASNTILSSGNISFNSDSGYTANDGTISYQGEEVATYEYSSEGGFVLTITAALSESDVNTLLQSVQYTAADNAAIGDSIAFTITMNDSSGGETSNTWTVDVVAKVEAPEVELGDYTLSAGQTHESYRATLPDDIVTDPAQLEFTWSVDGLPDGLSFDADTQTITGSPTLVGDYILTFTVTNSSGKSTSFELTLAVALSEADATPEVQIDDPSVTTQPSESFSYQFSANAVTDPQNLDLTWSASGLPDGVTFDANTLTLSGETTESGHYDVTINVVNSAGLRTSFTFTLTVATETSQHSSSDADLVVWQQREELNDAHSAEQNRPGINEHSQQLTSMVSNNSEVLASIANQVSDAIVSVGQTTQWLQDLYNVTQDDSSFITAEAESDRIEDANNIEVDLFSQLEGRSVIAVTQDNGAPLPAGVWIDPQTGVITVTPQALQQLDGHAITVTVQDAQGHRHQVKVDISDVKHAQTGMGASLEQQAQQTSQQSIQHNNQLWLAELTHV
ncbi:beta strand repeat-containing protein [Vibrio nitrifigilis]|uniref:Beta-propeller fold lactonase family protein n=1 Tax=Vibrio nitrifigilis TaxID=2789781 RepID=A0ABS0GKB9_9VIBR|nr:putative Ig domain-containing protein [Vibrio nitrifigilis]MBF9002886.1 beta-propeller fold lactonase family protein [Vibrio nitrifigilis]